MNPYFYSLGMLVTSRAWADSPYLSAMDVLAWCIEDEERTPPKAISFLFAKLPPETPPAPTGRSA